MLKIRGTYRHGQIVLEKSPPQLDEAPVVVTFLSEPGAEEERDSYESLCGLLPKEDAELMLRVIEEECERIDPETWQIPR